MQRWVAMVLVGSFVFIASAARADVAPKKGGCSTATERPIASWALAAVPAIALTLLQRRRARR